MGSCNECFEEYRSKTSRQIAKLGSPSEGFEKVDFNYQWTITSQYSS